MTKKKCVGQIFQKAKYDLRLSCDKLREKKPSLEVVQTKQKLDVLPVILAQVVVQHFQGSLEAFWTGWCLAGKSDGFYERGGAVLQVERN